MQGTTQHTPLSGLVDAARPDPWSAGAWTCWPASSSATRAGAGTARTELSATFAGWRPLAAQVAGLADTLPLAADGVPAAAALASWAAWAAKHSPGSSAAGATAGGSEAAMAGSTNWPAPTVSCASPGSTR